MKQITVYMLLAGLLTSQICAAQGLGRLFMSPQDRARLEKIRNAKEEPKQIETVKVEELIEPMDSLEEEDKNALIQDAIRLKGLVYRKNGKSAAWINDSNTFEGGLESQYLDVPTSEIKSDKVKIIMPDKETEINLKVGDEFNPHSTDDS